MASIKLRKIGNSIGIILPKNIIAELNLKAGDTLEVLEEKDGIKLLANDPDFADWAAAYRKANTKYKNALKQLAK